MKKEAREPMNFISRFLPFALKIHDGAVAAYP
jgi:hypothetical protein